MNANGIDNHSAVPTKVKLPIYMDNHATTPVDTRVLQAMMPYFSEKYGNAASRSHPFGWEAEAAVETARSQVAKLIGASSEEIIFTSGATESDNLAIRGAAESGKAKGNHIITVATEHKAVLDTCRRLETSGFQITYLSVNSDGLIDLQELQTAFTDRTILVSIMTANNEIGVIQPIEQIGEWCQRRGVLFHSDAVQAAGKIPVNVKKMNLHLASLTAHKIYGPKGCGALYVRRRNPSVQISSMIDGGGHERGLRSGTLNVPGIVGFGKACEIAEGEMAEESRRLIRLRDRLKDRIMSNIDGAYVNGSMKDRIPGNLNMRFLSIDGTALLTGLKSIALSSGSACTSASLEPSHVLKALGLSDILANSSLRFGIGRFNTEPEIDYVADQVVNLVKKLRVS